MDCGMAFTSALIVTEDVLLQEKMLLHINEM